MRSLSAYLCTYLCTSILAVASTAAAHNTLPRAKTGKVAVTNHTDQHVKITTDHWTNTRGRQVTRSVSWDFAPGESASLQINGSPFIAGKLGYSLRTAAGRTPEAGKVWIANYSGSGTFRVDIRATNIAKRNSSRSAVVKAWSLLEAPDTVRGILLMAHPTAEFRSIQHDKTTNVVDRSGKTLPGEFAVQYTYRWKSPLSGELNWTEFVFFFDARGGLESLRTRTSSWFEPFAGMDLLGQLVRDVLLEDPEIKNSAVRTATVRRLFREGNAKALLVYVLQLGQLGKAVGF